MFKPPLAGRGPVEGCWGLGFGVQGLGSAQKREGSRTRTFRGLGFRDFGVSDVGCQRLGFTGFRAFGPSVYTNLNPKSFLVCVCV